MIFYIVTPGFNSLSGGCMVLHRLAHILNELRETAYLVCDRKNPDWLGELHDGKNLDSNGVVIYPEIVSGNPLGLAKVVRWILMDVGFFGGDGIYGPKDLVYKYTKAYKVPDESRVNGILTVMNTNSNLFKDLGNTRTHDTCYLVRKGSRKPLNAHPGNAFCVDDYHAKGGDDYLVEMFNKYNTFISYDHATYISIQAALCGCLSIIVPEEGVTKEQWKLTEPFHGYGRSYGFDDYEWARTTQVLLKEAVYVTIDQSIEQTKHMIQACKAL